MEKVKDNLATTTAVVEGHQHVGTKVQHLHLAAAFSVSNQDYSFNKRSIPNSKISFSMKMCFVVSSVFVKERK